MWCVKMSGVAEKGRSVPWKAPVSASEVTSEWKSGDIFLWVCHGWVDMGGVHVEVWNVVGHFGSYSSSEGSQLFVYVLHESVG